MVCPVHCTVGKTDDKLSVLHVRTHTHADARTHTHINNTLLPVVFLIDDVTHSHINTVLMEWVRIEMPVTVHLVYNCYPQYPRDSGAV